MKESLDLSLNVATTVREDNQMLNSYSVLNTEEKPSSDSQGNSLDLQKEGDQFNSLSSLETKDGNIKTTEKTKYEDVQDDETVESTDAKTSKVLHFSNKELVKKKKKESDVEDQKQTPLNVKYHAAKPSSKQPENVVHMNVPSPSESVLTPLHETNELHRPETAKSEFEKSTKVQADEKSPDIWTPPIQRQISGVSSTYEHHADEEITKGQQPSEEGSESGSSVDRKPNQDNQADAKVIYFIKRCW